MSFASEAELPSSAGRRRQVLADGTLIFVTFIWGSTFVLVKDIVEQVPPMLFLAVRFALGSVALALVAWALGRWRGFNLRELAWGTLIGVALGVGYTFQTVGLRDTTATNAGFITGMSVVLVPVLGLFVLRQRPGLWSWTGVMLATAGLALLSFRLGEGVTLNSGDFVVLGCAFAFALQIVLVSRVASSVDPIRLTTVQIAVAGILNGVGAVLFERQVAGLPLEVWAGAAFLGLVATALAITIQVTVQRFTTAVHAALIFTLEPVFAAIFGVWLQNDRLEESAWLGAMLILSGMLIAELGPYILTRRAARRMA